MHWEATVATFFRIMEYNKRQKSIYEGPLGILTIIVEVIQSFFWDIKRRKLQNWKNKGFFRTEIVLAQLFSQ